MKKYEINPDKSPLINIDTSFHNYVSKRTREKDIHMKGSVPDYAFSLDNELRARLDKIPGFFSLCKKITATQTSRMMQIYNQQGLLVGPNQYPEIYQMGMDCAHRLGIGVPNIYIVSSSEMNARTLCADDVSPMIVLYTGIIDRMTPGELKCVIGHECGHIHNLHSIYAYAIDILLNSGKGSIGVILSYADIALMRMWTRAQEITADRAALICSDSLKDAWSVNYKLMSGGTINTSYDTEADLQALRQQLEVTLNNPTKLLEIMNNHPSSIRRIFAEMEFAECQTYYSWRPEAKKPDSICRSKEQTDARVQKLVNIWNNR